MDEDGTIIVELLQVDDEFAGIMFGVGENLCAKEGDDMIRDYWRSEERRVGKECW